VKRFRDAGIVRGDCCVPEGVWGARWEVAGVSCQLTTGARCAGQSIQQFVKSLSWACLFPIRILYYGSGLSSIIPACVVGWKFHTVDKIHSHKSDYCGDNYIKPFHITPQILPIQHSKSNKKT
jgi:hypothetical protein